MPKTERIFPLTLVVCLCIALLFSGCSFHKRKGYDRRIAGYPAASYKGYNKKENRVYKPSGGALENIIKPWIGTPYKFGGESKSGIDCSGFVMQVFRKYKGIELPHSTRESFKMGKNISKSDLQKGDVVFFGNWLGVNHSGIYMGNNTFAEASSSRGVIYEKFNSGYWAPKYKGARRY